MKEILEENERRKRLHEAEYDPIAGIGCCGERVKVVSPSGMVAEIPVEMTLDVDYASVGRDINEWEKMRCRHDFEFWAARCVTIRDKKSGRYVKFVLNRAQRRLVGVMEGMRREGRPIRIILLKARQGGGSTVTQMYMAWMQMTRRRNWHSLVCAHVKDTASGIRGMYSMMLRNYPRELWEGDGEPSFSGFEQTLNTRQIKGRGCTVTVGTSGSQDSVRGFDYAMAHLSEVAFWGDSARKSPDEFLRAICGSILREPDTLIVLESTANGIGNYFHREWKRAVKGKSDKTAVFIPWYEIDLYTARVGDYQRLWETLTPYERKLWERHGCTLEQIQWYRDKLLEAGSAERMAAEYPTDDVEAFCNTGNCIFPIEKIDELRKGCCEPVMKGDLVGKELRGPKAMVDLRFEEERNGKLKVWRAPEERCDGNRHVVVVDIGGRSERSDFSVITVLDRRGHDNLPEVVAQWRGHIDHDLLAWKSAAIATWYGEALLVIESNTLETARTEGDHSEFILTELNYAYLNLYHRILYDRVTLQNDMRLGFHTNTSTKPMVIDRMIQAVKSRGYVERDMDACDELSVYELKPNGSYGAMNGYHDDMLMTRAIGLHVIATTDFWC